MTGVILAAGTGSRLRPLTDSAPKCLISVGGRSILQRTIENLISCSIDEIVIVTGYRADQVHRHVLSRFGGVPIRFQENRLFASTNNIYSLWMALQLLPSGGMLLLDSDIVFDRRILTLLSSSEHDNCLALTSRHPMGNEEVKVTIRPDRSIIALGKEIPPTIAAGESIGIEQFGEGAVHSLKGILESIVVHQNRVELFYESAFQQLIDDGASIYSVDVGDLRCTEIDTLHDLEKARNSFGGECG